MTRYLFPVIALATFAAPVRAQTALDTTAPTPVANAPDRHKDGGVRGLVALGGGFTPRYEGASKYQAIPFALAAVRYRGVEFNLVGPNLKLDLGGGGDFLFGPILGLSNARSRKDAESRVKLLDTIGNSVNYGGFLGYRFGGNENGQGRIVVSVQATKDSKSDKGMSYEAGVSYAAIRAPRIFATFDLTAQANDRKYSRSFFGVTAAESAASGLAAYRPGGGLNKISGGLTAGYQLNSRWGLLARASGGTYVGDAVDSPIVKDGSKSFGLFVTGVSFAF